MKTWLCIALLVGPALHQDTQPKKTQQAHNVIAFEQIIASHVIGKLGVKLGDCFELQATVIEGNTRRKYEDGKFFLNVTHVQGKALSTPVQMEHRVHQFATGNVKLAHSAHSLYEVFRGKKPANIDPKVTEQLRRQYVGSKVSLLAYETGGFGGIPNGLPKDFLQWSDVGFGYRSTLVVMDQKH